MPMLLYLPFIGGAGALSARAWASSIAGRPAGKLELGLLPFPVNEALLPGETKQVHLFEARFIQLFADAAAKQNHCCGQMLFTPRGEIPVYTSLLQVEEYKKQEFGVWAKLKCVGRVKLASLRETEWGYMTSIVEILHDLDETEASLQFPSSVSAASLARSMASAAEKKSRLDVTAENAAQALSEAAAAAGVAPEAVLQAAEEMLAKVDSEVRHIHTSVANMQSELNNRQGVAHPGETEWTNRKWSEGNQAEAERPDGDEAERSVASSGASEPGQRVEWGHELRVPEHERCASLDEIVGARYQVLTSQGPDLPPIPSLHEALANVWRVSSETDAERQLLSFAAVATLPPADRVLALSMTSTTERLTHALCALRKQQRRLAALLALQRAASAHAPDEESMGGDSG